MSSSLIKTNDKEILTSKHMYKNIFIIELAMIRILSRNTIIDASLIGRSLGQFKSPSF